MTANGRAGRLDRLSTIWQVPCRTCYGHPSRLTYADPETQVVWFETLPERGCPACGRPIVRAHRVMIPDDGTGTILRERQP